MACSALQLISTQRATATTQSPGPLDDLPHVREALRAREAHGCFLAVDGRAERDAKVVVCAEVRAALQVQRVEVARQ